MFLSIIVPTYNVSKYIEKCIDSLLDQDCSEYEIIVIDDASTDNTLNILEKYSSQVNIVKKDKNSGLSNTRNLGIDLARGDYIWFVDGDDYIDQNAISRIKKEIYKYNKTIDVAYFGYKLEKNGNVQERYDYFSEADMFYTNVSLMKSELTKRNFPVPACYAFYRAAFLKKNQIKFRSGLLHEDELWSPIVLMYAKNVITIGITPYHYIIRSNSITTQKDKTKNGMDMLEICYELIDISNKKIDDKLVLKLMHNHIAMVYMKAMTRGKLYRKPYCNKVKKLFPLKYSYYFKDKMKALLFAFNFIIYYKLDCKYGHNGW